MKIEIISNIFAEHYGIKLEITHKQKWKTHKDLEAK